MKKISDKINIGYVSGDFKAFSFFFFSTTLRES